MTRSEITDLLQPLTPAQRIRAAIYAAQSLGSHGPVWDAWAGRWLDGTDRSGEAAWAAEAVAEAEAAWAAARAATWRSEAVARAAAPWTAVASAEAVARAAAPWTARAAAAAIQVRLGLDLAQIVRRAVQDEPAKETP
jgi:hypothetical protein